MWAAFRFETPAGSISAETSESSYDLAIARAMSPTGVGVTPMRRLRT